MSGEFLSLRSPTLELAHRVERARAAGHSVLGVSTPAFPDRGLDTGARTLPVKLAPGRGDAGLREQLARSLFARWGAGGEDLLVVSGAKAGLLVAVAALCRPGGTVALPTPCWPTYEAVAYSLGRRVKVCPCRSDQGWEFVATEVLDGLQAGDMVALSNPNNPTGRVYSSAAIAALSERCAKSGVTLLLDESFSETVDAGTTTTWGVCGERRGIVVLNSVSKNFLIQGWRIGALLAAPTVLEQLESVQTALLSPPPAPMQLLLRDLLAAGTLTSPEFGETRRRTERRLTAIGCSVFPSGGTFCCYPRVPGLAAMRDDLERDAGLFMLAGADFLHDELDFVRLSLLQPPGELDHILERLAACLQ